MSVVLYKMHIKPKLCKSNKKHTFLHTLLYFLHTLPWKKTFSLLYFLNNFCIRLKTRKNILLVTCHPPYTLTHTLCFKIIRAQVFLPKYLYTHYYQYYSSSGSRLEISDFISTYLDYQWKKTVKVLCPTDVVMVLVEVWTIKCIETFV